MVSGFLFPGVAAAAPFVFGVGLHAFHADPSPRWRVRAIFGMTRFFFRENVGQ